MSSDAGDRIDLDKLIAQRREEESSREQAKVARAAQELAETEHLTSLIAELGRKASAMLLDAGIEPPRNRRVVMKQRARYSPEEVLYVENSWVIVPSIFLRKDGVFLSAYTLREPYGTSRRAHLVSELRPGQPHFHVQRSSLYEKRLRWFPKTVTFTASQPYNIRSWSDCAFSRWCSKYLEITDGVVYMADSEDERPPQLLDFEVADVVRKLIEDR